jgi:hypothetical protein
MNRNIFTLLLIVAALSSPWYGIRCGERKTPPEDDHATVSDDG